MSPTQRRQTKIKRLLGLTAAALTIGMLTAGLSVQAGRAGASLPSRSAVEDLRPGLQPNAVDIGFLQSMHLHHAQAVQMAMLLRHSADFLEIRGLADAIFVGQTHEMGLMKGWLTAWGAPVLSVAGPMAWVEQVESLKTAEDVLYVSRCRKQGGRMEGLATPEEINALAASRGAEQEHLFLQLMIKHHRAALDMANFAKRNGQSELAKGFAHSVVKEQLNEIGWMQNRLAS